MDLARRELGPDAMLVETKDTSSANRHLGDYEVVFAWMPGEGLESKPVAPSAEKEVSNARLASELSELRTELDRILRFYETAQRWSCRPVRTPGIEATIGERLTSAGLSADWAADLAADTAAELATLGGAVSPAELETAAVRVLARQISGTKEPALDTPRVLALVGPPGAGKTTTIVKMAIHLGLSRRKLVRLVSADGERIGGSDQLRRFASILAIPFDLVETPAALAHRLSAEPGEITLIDTPGLGPADLPDSARLLETIATHSNVERILVLPATLSRESAAAVRARFESVHPTHLCLSHADEAASFGPVLNEVLESRLPVAFVTTGQRIPEDFTAADPGLLAEATMRGGNPWRTVAAGTAWGEVTNCEQGTSPCVHTSLNRPANKNGNS